MAESKLVNKDTVPEGRLKTRNGAQARGRVEYAGRGTNERTNGYGRTGSEGKG